jgi:CubicO group peptidase (beta-lactamase class C family)
MRRFLAICLVFAIAGVGLPRAASAQDDTPWPTDGWQTSTPEAQGIDSAMLADMFESIARGNYNIDSLLIIRNGNLVAEMVHYPYDAATLHHIFSCTKSVTSTLIGMALARGAITSLDQRVLDFFPDRTAANLDDAKRAMTLEDLLTMSGGFDWPGGMREYPTLDRWTAQPDWVQAMLDWPVKDEPGTRFTYNSGGSHLLSAIFQQATGQTAEAFAAENLFAPLGITDWFWNADPQGVSIGGWGLWLTPREMAKFGYLFLNGGAWDGQQIVPADWVETATRQHIQAGGQWLTAGYGYQWWIDKYGHFMALGYGGQYIVVVPEQNLVMVTTSALLNLNYFVPERMLNDYILPAAESVEPLPPNPAGVERLNASIAAFADAGEAAAVPPPPDVAATISGQTYRLTSGSTNYQTVALAFPDGQDSAILTLDGTGTVEIGLDGVYRFSPANEPGRPAGALIAARGGWRNETTFAFDYYIIGSAQRFTVVLRFDGDRLNFRVVELISGQNVAASGERVR